MTEYGYLLPTRGVVLESDDPETLATSVQSDVIDLARRAEALGFDSVWVGDSVLAKPRLEPLTTLAGVARETDTVDLGTAVYLPTLRSPVHVAHATATVDQLSGGRLALGVGIGSDVEAEYAALDLDFGTRGARMDELLEIVTGLWEGDTVDFEGAFFDLSDASIGFGPVRDPPIYVPTAAFDPSSGFPVSIRDRLVNYGGGWLPIGISPESYETGLDRIHTLFEDADRDPASIDPAYYLDAVIAADRDTALETARDFYDRYYPAWDRLSDEQIMGKGAFGPAEHVAETLSAYEDAGVETMIVRFTGGDQRSQLRELADIVG